MGCCEGVEIGMYDDVGKRKMGAVITMKVGTLFFLVLARFSALVLFSQAVERLVFCFLHVRFGAIYMYVTLPRLARNALAGWRDGVW